MKNEELKMILNSQFTAVRALVEARADAQDAQLKEIREHQKWQNGKLERHDKCIDELKEKEINIQAYQSNCPANKVAEKMQKRWFWFAVGILFAVAYFILEALYNETGLGKFIERIL